MNLLESLSQPVEKSNPTTRSEFIEGELLALRLKWANIDGGWTEADKDEIEKAMKANPDVEFWKWFLAGLDWTPDVPGRLEKVYLLLRDEGLINAEQCSESIRKIPNLGYAIQMREGKSMGAWVKEHRDTNRRRGL